MKKGYLVSVILAIIIAAFACSCEQQISGERELGRVGHGVLKFIDHTKDGHEVLVYCYFSDGVSALHIPESCPKCKELKGE